MTPEQWRRVETLFEATASRPEAERAAFLDAACDGDATLRREVESLLAANRSGDSFLPPGGALRASTNGGLSAAGLIGTTFGEFAITSLLGVGGMGEVYLARDTKLGRDVALKVLPQAWTSDPDRRARFAREARMLAAFSHPNVGAIYGLEDIDGRQALVLEYVPGDTLADRLRRGPLCAPEALGIARQIADALDDAHEKGIVHRDLKPANIKLKSGGVVKVLDFGLAKARADGGDTGTSATATGATRIGTIVGTPRYMSPEQARGQAVDKRTDIWAFGCVLYEMLTARPAFPGESPVDAVGAVLGREPDWSALPADTPVSIQRLLRRCLEKDPKARQRDIGDLRRELDANADADGSAERTGQRSRRRAWTIAAFGSAAGAAVMGLALWLARPVASAPPPSVHMRVDLGPTVSLESQIGADVVLSPDGGRLVIVSKGRLWTRRLDQEALIELPGTLGASQPFFSPDGAWVAFAANGSLKKTPAAGGDVIPLCPAPSFRGGSWGDDGQIIAALDALDGLSRVSASGGAVTRLTTLAEGERTHRWPQVLPGSRAVLFTSHTLPADFDGARVEWLSLPDGRRHVLERDATFGRFITDRDGTSFLLYAKGTSLLARPWRLGSAASSTEAVTLLDDVYVSNTLGYARADASPHALVYRRPENVAIAWLDAGGGVKPLVPGSGQFNAPTLGPDGRRLAYSSGSQIKVYDVTRETHTLLVSNTYGRGIAWTTDGRRVIFTGRNFQLAAVPSDGASAPQVLTGIKGVLAVGGVTAGDRSMTFQRLAPSGGWDLFSVPLTIGPAGLEPGVEQTLLSTPADERHPEPSPDGRWLAFQSTKNGRPEIYVRAMPDQGREWLVSSAGGVEPRWSPDGRTVMYVGTDDRLWSVPYRAMGDQFEVGRPVVWSPQALWRKDVQSGYSLAVTPSGLRAAALVHPAAPNTPEPEHEVTLLTSVIGEIQRRLASRP